jgi:hypothetical protein
MTLTVPAGRPLVVVAALAVSVVVPLTVTAGRDAPARAVAQGYCAVGETEDPFTLNCVPAMATGTAPDQTDQVYANPNSPVAVDNGTMGGAAIGRSH